jgi:hypothetical protein
MENFDHCFVFVANSDIDSEYSLPYPLLSADVGSRIINKKIYPSQMQESYARQFDTFN